MDEYRGLGRPGDGQNKPCKQNEFVSHAALLPRLRPDGRLKIKPDSRWRYSPPADSSSCVLPPMMPRLLGPLMNSMMRLPVRVFTSPVSSSSATPNVLPLRYSVRYASFTSAISSGLYSPL